MICPPITALTGGETACAPIVTPDTKNHARRSISSVISLKIWLPDYESNLLPISHELPSTYAYPQTTNTYYSLGQPYEQYSRGYKPRIDTAT